MEKNKRMKKKNDKNEKSEKEKFVSCIMQKTGQSKMSKVKNTPY